MTQRRLAVAVIAAALALDIACGLIYAQVEHITPAAALYCSVGNAVTEGACTAPATVAGHIVNVAEFLTVVPLVTAVFSLLTAGLTSAHVRDAEERIKDHVTRSR